MRSCFVAKCRWGERGSPRVHGLIRAMTNAGYPVLQARLLLRGVVLGEDCRGGRGGSKASPGGDYNVIQKFTNVDIDYAA